MSSKFMSVNVGAPNIGVSSVVCSKPPSGILMSKSDGSGSSVNWSSFCVGSGSVVGVSGAGLPYGVFMYGVPAAAISMRERIKCGRNSFGISGGNGSGSGVFSAGVSGAGASGVEDGFANACLMQAGTGTVISGFLLRTTKTVVATYMGRAASIKMPNTKPGKPRNWAWNSRCHWAPLNILNLNRPYKITHITAI